MEIQARGINPEPVEPGVLVLDIPVIHQGYINLLRRHTDGSIKALHLVGEDLLERLGVVKEIRAVDPETTRRLLLGLDLPFAIEVLGLDGIGNLPSRGIFTARDEVSRRLRETFFPNAQLTQETAFLRWDASNVTSTHGARVDGRTQETLHVAMMRRAREIAENSSDWWRQVGAVIARDGRVIVEAYNQALPTDNKPYIDGNPRDAVAAGTLAFLVGTVHAEQAAIAKAAGRNGGLEGSDLYLTSYPCPPCATSLGLAGVKRCFTSGGNAYLDAEEVLAAMGIETISVGMGD